MVVANSVVSERNYRIPVLIIINGHVLTFVESWMPARLLQGAEYLLRLIIGSNRPDYVASLTTAEWLSLAINV